MKLLVQGHEAYAATGGRAFDAAKPVIVFIHGAGLDHTCWGLQSRWFAWHGWSVLAVDLPGHGRSKGQPLASIGALTEWVLALLDAAGVGKAALAGHSMGAVIALETAAAAPERVTELALLGIASAMPVHPNLLASARETPEKAYDMMTGWCFANAAKIGGNKAPGLWMTGTARALFDRNQPGVLATDLAACGAWTSGLENARKIAASTVLVLGRHDVMTPAKKGQELAAAITGARCVVLEASGHMMMQEAPDATLDAMIAHLGSR